jgi:CYTH domain-containing protein
MKGFVLQTERDEGGSSRYYLLATDDREALTLAAALLSIEQKRLRVLRELAQWELDVFVPFPNEIYPAP